LQVLSIEIMKEVNKMHKHSKFFKKVKKYEKNYKINKNGKISYENENVNKICGFCSKLYKTLSVFMLSVLFFNFCSFDLNYNLDTINFKMEEIYQISKIDSLRFYNVNKIKHIAHIYETDLTQAQLDSIANYITEICLYDSTLNVNVICASISHESGWKTRAKSSVGARGLMQIMPYTGTYLAERRGISVVSVDILLYDPIVNVKLGCDYLTMMVSQYGSIEAGLVGYNAGPKWANVYRKTGNIVPKETQSYLPAVLSNAERYRLL